MERWPTAFVEFRRTLIASGYEETKNSDERAGQLSA